jgi:hypothetical protein
MKMVRQFFGWFFVLVGFALLTQAQSPFPYSPFESWFTRKLDLVGIQDVVLEVALVGLCAWLAVRLLRRRPPPQKREWNGMESFYVE